VAKTKQTLFEKRALPTGPGSVVKRITPASQIPIKHQSVPSPMFRGRLGGIAVFGLYIGFNDIEAHFV
jgi:hypothetical protein